MLFMELMKGGLFLSDKIKKIVMVLAVLYLLVSIYNYMVFTFIKIDNSHALTVTERLGTKVSSGDSFVMAEITDFIWDTLYVFQPYTTRDAIKDEVGTRWALSKTYLGWQLEKKTERLVDDTLMAFVFVRDGQVVCDLTWDLTNGNLLFLSDKSPYDRQMKVVFTE